MLNYIIPPIVIILGLAALIFFIFRKSSNLPKEMILGEGAKMGKNIDSRKRKIFKFTQFLLKITERGMQYFKLISLKFYNKTDNWFHSIRKKRVNRINGIKDTEDENKAIVMKEEILINKEKDIFVDNFKVTQEEIRPMISSKVVQPDSRNEVKNEFEKALIERIALNPRDIEAYERLGDYYIEIGNFSDSLSCFEEVLRLSPINRKAKIKLKRLQKIVFSKM